MINGLDWSGWTTIKDAGAMFKGQLPIDFAWIRAHDGYRDDTKFPAHRKIMREVSGPNGSVLWGPYMYLGYSSKIGSYIRTAAEGDDQAENMWNLATAGGREHQLPAAVDCEKMRVQIDGVWQYFPLPPVDEYMRTLLVPAINRLTTYQGRRPVIYANADMILNYLKPALAKYPIVTECPLWIASWGKTMTVPAYWSSISAFWPQWLAWQHAGDVRDWPGVDDVDLNRMPGTRAQLKAWLTDPSKPMPSEGGAEPEPEDPQEPETPGEGEEQMDLAELTAAVTEIRENVKAIRQKQEAIYK